MSIDDPFISIFNDVVETIMRGPSSSHTAGAYRIAMLARSLYGRMPSRVQCASDPDGSYAPTYLPLGVDNAFCAGLIGLDMLDHSYETAVEQANLVTSVHFEVAPLEFSDHPNTMRILLSGDQDLTVWARSTGGGVVEIFRLNDEPVLITGKHLDALVMLGERKTDLIAKIDDNEALRLVGKPDAASSSVQNRCSSEEYPADALRWEFGTDIPVAEPVFFPQDGNTLARSAADLLALAHERSLSLGETAVAYECELLGISREAAVDEMSRRYEVMRESVDHGYDGSKVNLAWLQPHASDLQDAQRAGRLPYGGFHAAAAIRAHETNDASSSKFCAGMVPSALFTEKFVTNRALKERMK